MSQTYTFHAKIEDAGDGGAFVTIPFDVEKAFGKKRVKVTATIDGEPYRGSLVRMGGSNHILGILKAIREKTGKSIGDEVEITIQEDTEAREVAIPLDLQQALENSPGTEKSFRQLSYTHQKEYIQWIDEAKRPSTRQKRIAQAVEILQQGKKDRSNR